MGGTLTAPAKPLAPKFMVTALKDPGTPGREGNDLQRIQIIKGWLDVQGNTHEQVVDVAGNKDSGAWVNTDSCEATGSDAASLCAVWQDENFDPAQSAFNLSTDPRPQPMWHENRTALAVAV